MKYLMGIVLACVTAGVVAEGASKNAPFCSDIRELLGPPNKLLQHALVATSLKGGEEEYYNVDVDGDDVNDVIQGGCAASLQPADPCELSIELSTGKKQSFTFGYDERFYLARYRSHVYAIVSQSGGDGSGRVRSILAIDKNGINRACIWP